MPKNISRIINYSEDMTGVTELISFMQLNVIPYIATM